MMDCLFCKIIEGSIPSKKAYEDDKIFAFYDIAPQAPVHILVIPKAHMASMDEVNADNADVVAHIFTKIPEIAKEAGITNGYRVVSNCGDDACQTVKHLHFHILGGTQLKGQMC
ncbi:MAG: histidine triad nucleotide-binding protein [Clostridia bacterium]|nr:histidine triad nucleotide-binding protein [Clostridia bacterium]